jgi:hypothetical protein
MIWRSWRQHVEGGMDLDLQLKYVKDGTGKRRLTIADDRRAAAIAFVQKQATTPAAEIEAVVQAGQDQLLAALEGVSEAQASWKPAPDEWSILELMAHVVTTKRIMPVLARSLRAGALPPGFGPQLEDEEAQDGVTMAQFPTLAESRAAAVEAHDDLVSVIRTLDDGEFDTETRFRHFVFGALNCREWAVFQRLHDADHTPQIGRIKAAPGYPSA